MAIGRRMSRHATELPALQELDRVTLRVAREDRSGRTVPAGADGTVVAVLKDGAAYMVEFTRPFAAVVTAEAGTVMPLSEATATGA